MTLDLSGGKFGRLTLVRQVKGRSYEFLCDCGKVKLASIYDVRRGAVKSCGCLRDEHASRMGRSQIGANVKDLTGLRFGMLTVLARGPNTKHQTTSWLCACDCGGQKVVTGNHLTTGNTASCGCAYTRKVAVRPEQSRAKSNAYVKRRIAEDAAYALSRRTQQLVYASLRARGSRKSRRWEALVGYTVSDLRDHLQRAMPAGYTWADFMSGALHIDHIVPLAAFNYASEGDLDFKRAWALSNLRLLPARENLAKSDTLLQPFQPSLCF